APLPATRGVQPQSSRTPIESGVFAMLSSTRQNFVRTSERSKSTLRLPVHWHFHWHFSRHKRERQSSISDIRRHHRCATRLTSADAVLSCSPAPMPAPLVAPRNIVPAGEDGSCLFAPAVTQLLMLRRPVARAHAGAFRSERGCSLGAEVKRAVPLASERNAKHEHDSKPHLQRMPRNCSAT